MTRTCPRPAPVLLSLAASAAFALAAPAASAQGDADTAALVAAFSGQWFSFDRRGADGEPCLVELGSGGEPPYPATAASCDGALSGVAAWSISGGQILLLDGPGGRDGTDGTDGPAGRDGTDGPGGAVLARLGGNQFRISGETGPGAFAVLERREGDPNSRAVRRAITTYRCIYRGFTDACATRAELAVPEFTGDAPVRVEMLVNLNVRRQPRADSGLVGVVETGAVITLRDCLVTSDGPWCAARFGDETGWLARTALRRDTWPVMTFVETD